MTFGDIQKETQFLLGFENDINFAIYKKPQMTRHSNRALDELTNLIFRVDGSWQFDDKNHPDLPIAVTDVVTMQGQYTMDAKHLLVKRLEIQAPNGDWVKLINIDDDYIPVALEEYEKINGTPKHYQKVGESLFLYPKPDYDMTNGLKIYYARPPFYFTENDDALEPGFAETFHMFIPYYNAFHYCISNPELQNKAKNFKVLLDEKKLEIKKHYGSRRKRKRLTVRVPESL